ALYAAATALLALTYGLLGVLLGPVFGRVAGGFIAFLIPFLDIGIGQSPMLRGEPADWATYLPGYGGTRLFIDGALTASFDETGALLIALGWLAALAAAAALLFRHAASGQWWSGSFDRNHRAAPRRPAPGSVAIAPPLAMEVGSNDPSRPGFRNAQSNHDGPAHRATRRRSR
ncbi:MAG: hypothetical protein ACRD0W_12075, partial [Acidimicrobiales bacterium]